MTGDGSRVGRSLGRVGRFSARNPRVVIVASLALLLVAGTLAVSAVQLNMGVMLYVDDDSETARNWAAVESGYDRGNVVFVVVETGAEVTDPGTVELVDRLDERYTEVEGVSSVRSLADVVRLGAKGDIPDTYRGVERAVDRVAARSNATRTLARTMRPESGETILLVSYGNVSKTPDAGGLVDLVATKDSKVMERRLTDATDAVRVPASVSVTVTGAAIFENAALELMILDVLALFAGGFVLVLVVVYLVMRRRLDGGWRGLLSLGTAMAALVVMLGVMGVLGYDFNAIMLSVLPVGLGLGVDYGLQMQTRYAEERDGGLAPADAAGVASGTTGRTLLLAAGTTVVGFGSLLVAPVPPVRQFGVTAATSVVASMGLSLTLLVAALVTLDEGDSRPGGSDAATATDGTRGTGASPTGGRVPGRLERLANAAARTADARPLLILLVVVPAAAGGAVVYADVETTQQMLDYWPRDLEERENFEAVTGTVASPKTVYVLVQAEDPYEPSTFREIASFEHRLSAIPDVNAVDSPVGGVEAATGGEIPDSPDRLRRLVERQSRNPLSGVESPSAHPGQVLLTLRVDDVRGREIRTLVDRIEGAAGETGPGTSVAVTGKPVLNRVIIENVTAGFEGMTLLSFTVAFLFLVVVLRSVRDSLVLILSVPATAALLMLGAMYLLDIPWNPGTVSMASIALGIGIDYGLHVHERYRELLGSGEDEPAAMAAALRKLSRPIFGSGLTTMAGFGVLLFSQFPVVRNFGKTLVLVIAFSLLATFVTFPAVALLASSNVATLRTLSVRSLLPGAGDVESGSSPGSDDRESGDAPPSSGGPGATGNLSPGGSTTGASVSARTDGESSPGTTRESGASAGDVGSSTPGDVPPTDRRPEAGTAQPNGTEPGAEREPGQSPPPEADSQPGGQASATEGGAECPDCRAAVSLVDDFCTSCGAPLPGPEPVTECPDCGTGVAADQSYCTGCGVALDQYRPGGRVDGSPSAGTAASPSTGAPRSSAGTEEVPESSTSELVVRARGRRLTVEEGDCVGREVRHLVVETGGERADALCIHREHVRFVHEDGRFHVVALGDNPTSVNGRRLPKGGRRPVGPGDEIGLSGVVRLRIERTDADRDAVATNRK